MLNGIGHDIERLSSTVTRACWRDVSYEALPTRKEEYAMEGPIFDQTEDWPLGVLTTEDEFVACVPWGQWRAVTVYRRRHGGRTWVRFRTWNKHRKKLVWYPTKRYFVVPIEHAVPLASALCMAAGGASEPLPDWLEHFQYTQTGRLDALGLSEEDRERAERRIMGA